MQHDDRILRWHSGAFQVISSSNGYLFAKFMLYAAVVAVLRLLTTGLSVPFLRWYQSNVEYLQHGNPELPPVTGNLIISLVFIVVLGIMCRTLETGWIKIALEASRLRDASERRITDGFSGSFPKIAVIEIIRSLGIYLGLCCLIAPGVWLFYRWRMVYFVCADNPQYGPIRCLRESARLTAGSKKLIFTLDLTLIMPYLTSFLITLITNGIADLFMRPKIAVTMAFCYNELSGHEIARPPENGGNDSPGGG
ncbi:MAG: DUF975 family protein [Oscillospiraceae bacterium]|nr:DUF975 family protein [Oscillospiraceae bacterium]